MFSSLPLRTIHAEYLVAALTPLLMMLSAKIISFQPDNQEPLFDNDTADTFIGAAFFSYFYTL
ncbi:MAG: hypothetical protein MUE37_10540 [Bacteroidales bacterium]|jgi:hypothetical protein|nr:hypothetical protein [Bacteroidales bacterium]